MNTEEVAEAAKQLGMEEGKKEGLITGIQNLISVMKDYGESNQGILQRLKQKYGKNFSEQELENFLKQSQVFNNTQTAIAPNKGSIAVFCKAKKYNFSAFVKNFYPFFA